MVKSTFVSSVSVQFVPSHKGAPYTVDGVHFFNFGNYAEAVSNEALGNGFGYDKAHGRWDAGSDIESHAMSVKSSGASLACLYGETFEEILGMYASGCPSKVWRYVALLDGEWVFYDMSKAEFLAFVNEWATIAKESGSHKNKVRFRKTSGKMLAWLDERC